MLGVILIVLLIVLVLSRVPTWPASNADPLNWALTVVLILLLVMLLLGYAPGIPWRI